MTDLVPSKDLVSQLRALPAGARLLGYTAAEHIERLETALRGIQSCSTCEACRGAATIALGGDQHNPSPSIRALAESAYKDGYGADLTDDRDLSERTHELIRSLSRPAHEREPPHCSSCACPPYQALEPGVRRCDDEHAPVYYDGDECPVCDVMQRWITEANAPRAAQPQGDSIVALDSALAEINDMIVQGHLPGDGTDQTAQRNGIILAANKLREIIDRATPPSNPEHPDLRADAKPYCRLCGGDHWVGAHDRALQPPGDGQ